MCDSRRQILPLKKEIEQWVSASRMMYITPGRGKIGFNRTLFVGCSWSFVSSVAVVCGVRTKSTMEWSSLDMAVRWVNRLDEKLQERVPEIDWNVGGVLFYTLASSNACLVEYVFQELIDLYILNAKTYIGFGFGNYRNVVLASTSCHNKIGLLNKRRIPSCFFLNWV